jgi:hypothetical protein
MGTFTGRGWDDFQWESKGLEWRTIRPINSIGNWSRIVNSKLKYSELAKAACFGGPCLPDIMMA